MRKTLLWVSVLAALVCSAPAFAQTAPRQTYFTFNQPVTLPGVTLPAGTYLFKLVDDPVGNRIVNVLDSTGTKSYAMLISIPAMRTDAPTAAEVSFIEPAAGSAPAIHAWWNAGQHIGHQFVYAKQQALSFARNGAPVTTVISTPTPDTGSTAPDATPTR